MAIKLNIGTVTDSGAVEVSDEFLKKAMMESRWQLGEGTINGRKISIERKWSLDEYEYRMNGTLIDGGQIEMYMPIDWMDWRNG